MEYFESLNELSKAKGFDILSCNEHKAMCVDASHNRYVLFNYIHDKELGYSEDDTKEREYFKTWEDFRKDYLKKLKVS